MSEASFTSNDSNKLSPAGFLKQYGYLTLNQLVKYVTDEFPHMRQSYPTFKRNVIDKGLIEFIEVGNQKRFTADSIEAYMETLRPKTAHPQHQEP